MHLKPLSNGCVFRRELWAANVFIACHTFTRGSDGTKESRRGLPLVWEDRRLCNPAHGRRARGRRHGGDSRAHVEPGAAGRLAASRARRGNPRGDRPRGRDESQRARARERLRVQTRRDGSGSQNRSAKSADEESGPAESTTRQEGADETEAGQKSQPRTA